MVVTWVNDLQDHRGTNSLYVLIRPFVFMVSSDRDERLGRALIRRNKLRMRRSYHQGITNDSQKIPTTQNSCTKLPAPWYRPDDQVVLEVNVAYPTDGMISIIVKK